MEIVVEERCTMSAGLRTLRNDRIDVMSFQSERLFDGCRRRHDKTTSRLDARHKSGRRQAEMKTDHFGLGLLDDLAHGIAKWREIQTRRWLRVEFQFAAIGRQQITPGLLAR